MRFGALILPDQRWSVGGGRWRRAEELGFDHAWTYDHLAWRSLRDAPWFAATTTLAAAATATSTIRLGPLVSSANFRHPVTFAKELMSLDDLSTGRLIAGIGAGAEGWDTTMLGAQPWSTAERTARFEEFVELTDVLLRQPATSWRGRYYEAAEARGLPGCIQQPRLPFAIAAGGPRGMKVAASHGDIWVTTGDRSQPPGMDAAAGARTVGDQVRRLEESCGAIGRDPATLRRMVVTGPLLEPCTGSVEQFREAVGLYRAAGVTDLVLHWPRPDPPYRADLDAFETVFASR